MPDSVITASRRAIFHVRPVRAKILYFSALGESSFSPVAQLNESSFARDNLVEK